MTFLTTRINHSNQETMTIKIFRVVIQKPFRMNCLEDHDKLVKYESFAAKQHKICFPTSNYYGKA